MRIASTLALFAGRRVSRSTPTDDVRASARGCFARSVTSLLSVFLVLPALFSQNVVTNPSSTQQIAHPIETRFEPDNFANIRYVTPLWNFSLTPTSPSTLSAGSVIITLATAPPGIDTASNAFNAFTGRGPNYYVYSVYLTAGSGGTSEVMRVTGGSCVPGGTNCTITGTVTKTHVSGYLVQSSTGGIQEAINDAWVNDLGTAPNASSQTAPYVKLESNTLYAVYATVYLRGRGSALDGTGAEIQCNTRDRCIYIGTTAAFPAVNHHKLDNLSMVTNQAVDGANVSSVCAGVSCSLSRKNGTYLITTAATHPFLAGDTVTCEYYSANSSQHWMSTVTSVPSSTSFTVSFGSANFATSPYTFGFCNIENAAIEDNSDHAAIQDLNIFVSNPASFNGTSFGAFNYGVVNDNDQGLTIERPANRSSASINPNGNHSTATWPMGAFVWERNDQGMNGITYVSHAEFTNVNCFDAGGNGAVFTDSVCQGFPTFGMRYFGTLQPLTFSNIYEESTGGTPNGSYSASGSAAQMGLLAQGGTGTKVAGTFPVSGWAPYFAIGGGAGSTRNYFVVPHSSVDGVGAMQFIGQAQPRSRSTAIPVQWPALAIRAGIGTITYDLLVTSGQAGVSPPIGGVPGAYSLATGLTTSSCNSAGMCSFSDTQAAASNYTLQPAVPWETFWFWPANMVINSNAPVLMDSVATAPGYVSTQGDTGVSIIADQCVSDGASWTRSPIWISCLAGMTQGGEGALSTILQQKDAANNGPPVNGTGRLNFGPNVVAPTDLITLQDSNFIATLTSNGGRHANSAGDMALGLDQVDGLSLRAKTSISQYLNTIPGNSSFLTRLSSSGFIVNSNLNAYRNPVIKTANFTILASQSEGFLDNTGAPGEVDFTLPLCGSNGLTYTFYIDNSKTLKVVASGGAKIRNASTLGTANGNIAATTTGNSVTLQCIGTSGADSVAEWIVTAIIGTWAVH